MECGTFPGEERGGPQALHRRATRQAEPRAAEGGHVKDFDLGSGLFKRDLGLKKGRFRAESKNCMALSTYLGQASFWGPCGERVV